MLVHDGNMREIIKLSGEIFKSLYTNKVYISEEDKAIQEFPNPTYMVVIKKLEYENIGKGYLEKAFKEYRIVIRRNEDGKFFETTMIVYDNDSLEDTTETFWRQVFPRDVHTVVYE